MAPGVAHAVGPATRSHDGAAGRVRLSGPRRPGAAAPSGHQLCGGPPRVNTSIGASNPAAARDLVSRAQVHDLVVDFYRRVALDDLLGPVFGEVAEVDWSVHIPKLVDYWCRV